MQRAHLCIEVVCEAGSEVALDRALTGDQAKVVGQLVMGGNDNPLPLAVVLRAAGSAKDLQHVQDPKVHKGTLLGVIDLRALDQEEGRQLDSFEVQYDAQNSGHIP